MALTSTTTTQFNARYKDGISVADLTQFQKEFDTTNEAGAAQDIKVALYSDAATLTAATTEYTTTNEISGTGYTAGGLKFSPYPTVTVEAGIDGNIHYVDFPDAVWTNATFTARGALIYRGYYVSTTWTTLATAIYDFGGNFVVTNGTFTIMWPPANISSAAIRVLG